MAFAKLVAVASVGLAVYLQGCGGGSEPTPAATPVVSVPGLGTLRGRLSTSSSAVAVFQGIPYARPPVGDLRWRPPQPHGAWKSPRLATDFGNVCFGITPQNASASEDCLFLNVATPMASLSNSKPLPVMVYIHGGGYNSGASNNNHPDVLVAHSNASVVVVTLNYRLNVFGFLGSALLRNRSADGSVGNYGIQDQRLALQWVRDHISAFGGDGSDVTIFGESAGGNSVLNHLTQPASFHLYSKAIVESGTYYGVRTQAHAEAVYALLLNETHCFDSGCLLHLGAAELCDAVSRISKLRASESAWGPVIDGISLKDYPQELIRRKEHNTRVPVVLGSNRDEDALFAAQDPSNGGYAANLSEKDLDSLFREFLGPLGEAGMKKVKALYAPDSYQYPVNKGNYSQSWWTAMRIATDGGLPAYRALGACTVRWTARLLLQGGTSNVFVYLFAHPSQEAIPDMNVGSLLVGTKPGSPLVPHASELPYVFGVDDLLSKKDGEVDLASAMSSYWLRFASAGNPNTPALPYWPAFSSGDERVQRFDVQPHGIHPQKHLREAACDFWDLHMTPNEDSGVAKQVIV